MSFHVCLLPFPSQRVHMIAIRVSVFVRWMRERSSQSVFSFFFFILVSRQLFV